jgi:hypothetical protein
MAKTVNNVALKTSVGHYPVEPNIVQLGVSGAQNWGPNLVRVTSDIVRYEVSEKRDFLSKSGHFFPSLILQL